MAEEQHLTKKELKEQRKAEQEAHRKAEAAAAREKKVKNLTIVIVSSVVIIGFLAWLISIAPEREVPTDNTPDQINPITEEDPTKGASIEDADVVVVEYGDFQCPACGQYAPIVSQLAEDFSGSVAFVYRHLPLQQIHPNAELSAQYAEAARRQGKFWEMHDLLFTSQGEWSNLSERGARREFNDYAEALELDMDQLALDLEDPAIMEKIDAQRIDAIGAGAQGTPTFFVDGALIQSPGSYDAFTALLNELTGNTTEETTSETPALPGVVN